MATCLAVLLVLCAAASGVAEQQTRSVAGVQKVIQMLRDMAQAAKVEKNDEEIAFAKFSKWCEMEQAHLQKDVKEGEERAEILGAEIEKLSSEAKVLGEEIDKLTSDIEKFTADKKAEEEQRATDHEAYLAEVKDYAESIDALERAILVLEKQNYDRPGQEALIELTSREVLPPKAQAYVASLIATFKESAPDDADEDADEDFMGYAAPEANAYEFQSGGIVQVLKDLLDEFSGKKGQAEKEEMNSQHASNLVVQDLVDSIENAQDDVNTKTKLKAGKLSKAATDKSDLQATVEVLEADKKTLSEMETECTEKTASFKEKQALRVGEIQAIEKAIEILSGDEVSGNANKYLDLAQRGASALLQVNRRSASTAEAGTGGVRRRLREFMAKEAQRLGSKRLSVLALRVSADPFAKVKGLIDSMITRLLNEANEDAAKEGWCDTEMGKSKVTRNKLNEDIDSLTAAIDDGKAAIVQLTEEMARLEKESAELQASMVEATAAREAEKAKNEVTIKDAQEAQKAVVAATAVLKEFYEKAGRATALLQGGQAPNRIKMGTERWKALGNPNYEATVETVEGTVKVDTGHAATNAEGEQMQTFGEVYQGQQDESGAVLAMLEVIMSDFANLEAETDAAEALSQKTYEDFMADAKQNLSTKAKKIELDTADKAAAETNLQTDTKSLKATQDELLAAERYYEKLVPQCVDQGMTWEERVAAREAEIASLREALKILGSADIATSA